MLGINNHPGQGADNLKLENFEFGQSLRNADLTNLSPDTVVRIPILDQLLEAIKCKTVKPGDPRSPSTPELMEERKQHISGLLEQVQDHMRGARWDRTFIRAAGERGPAYEGLLMRMSKAID